MRKLLWAGGAAVVLLIIVLLGLTFFVKSYLTSEKLKAIIVPRLEAATGRSVSIGRIDVSLFKGVVVKEISIRERNGNGNFIGAKEFILNYRLLPLLRKQLIIDKLELDSPRVSILRDKNGKYNFSDITEKKRGEQPREQPETKGPIPFTLVADRVVIRGAILTFNDLQRKIPEVTADVPDITLKTYVGRTPGEIGLTGHIGIGSIKTVLKGTVTDTSGSIDITDKDLVLSLTTMLGADSIKTSGSINNYRSAPDARINISAKQLDLDKLVPPEAAKRTRTSMINRDSAHLSYLSLVRYDQKSEFRASGQVRVKAVRYSGYDIRDFLMDYHYENGVMTLSPAQMALAGGRKINAAGTIKGYMKFGYDPEGAPDQIKRTAAGKGLVELKNIEIKSSPIMQAIARFTGVKELGAPRFDNAKFLLTIKNQKTLVNGSMNSRSIVMAPSGAVGFDKKIDMITDLKLSPALGSKLTLSSKMGYFKDSEGWTTVPLKISGTTEKPVVGLNTAAMGRQIQKGVQEQMKKRLFEKLLPK